MTEHIDQLFTLLDDADLRKLAMEKMEGYSNREIAEHQNCSVRTTERRLKLIRAKYEENFPD
jgi:DNA-directed RNA polymerase specialized sigma24 family protein